MVKLKTYYQDKKIIKFIILLLIILIQVIYITLIFGLDKVGYHADELSHYTFANNYSLDSEFVNNAQFDDGMWLDSESLWHRITVEPEHRFNYASVYINAAGDLNPPFHYYILHTICSLFPGTFSKWYGFIINIVSFAIGQFFLFKMSERITKGSTVASFCVILLYGFSVGALNTTIFLRMYSMATCIAIMFTYFSFELFVNRRNKDKKKIVKLLIAIFVSCFLGAYSLHLFLVYAFGITICYTLYYLISGNFKLFVWHGLSCAVSVGLSFLAFPSTASHTFQSTDVYPYSQAMYPQPMQFRILWYYLTSDLFGMHTSPWGKPTLVYCGYFFAVVLFFLVPICFVFRKEKWLKNLFDRIKKDFVEIKGKIKGFQYGIIPLLFVCLFMTYIISGRVSVFLMQWYSDRYMFIMYPAVVLLFISLIYFIVKLLVKNKHIITWLVITFTFICILWSNARNNKMYYFDYPSSGTTFDDIEQNADVIMLLSALWQLNSFTCEIGDTNQYFVTTFKTFEEENYDLLSHSDNPLYLFVDQNYIYENDYVKSDLDDELNPLGKYEYEVVDYFNNLEGVSSVEYVGTDNIFAKTIKIYRIYME